MKCSVIRAFFDKDTGIGYNVGNLYESTDSKRIAFLVENGFMQEPEKPKRSRKTKDGE